MVYPTHIFLFDSSCLPRLPDACSILSTSQVVVAEMHSALANPALQDQVVQYAKAVCDSMASLAETCK